MLNLFLSLELSHCFRVNFRDAHLSIDFVNSTFT
jgi:hypothetical protein